MMHHALEKSRQESWRRGAGCDEEGQVDVKSDKSTCHEESRISKCQSLLNQDIK
jgi:hypothetical protein